MFETKRLILREWKDADIAPFAAMNQDPDVMEFFPSTLDFEGTQALVEYIRQHFQMHGFAVFAVELKETAEFIGFVGLMIPNFEAHFTPCVEMAWRIAKKFWNQGYATEAAKMVLHLAFEKYGLREVVSFTPTVNKRSMRIMEKIGLWHDVAGDFNHPKLAKDHPLSRHVLYRLSAKELQARDAILIEPYNPEWPKQAGKEVDMLKSRLDFSWIKGIQHIGSTAIPELIAKPILDLAIGVTDLESAKALIPILREEDYTFWGDNPDKSKLFFVKGMPPFGEKRTHHIHVMPVTHHDWLLRPLFFDYLIAHPGAKQAYADLKQNLASQYQSDRETYTNSKTTFIRDINLKAVKPHLHFKPLAETDFPLLLKWLEEPHVKAWWDQDIIWTPELIAKKYALNRPVQAYVILIDEMPIGYIQFYDVKDFADADRPQCPGSVAGLDYYIGEPGFLKKGFAPIILQKFLLEKVKPLFAHCLVDPDIQNVSAIRAYEKAGFKAIETLSHNVCWMLADLIPKALFTWVDDYFRTQDEKIAHFEEVRIVPWSQVYRVTTSQNQLCYLKRMSPPFAIEAKLLQYWAIQQNHSVPRILATHPELNCFLMQDSGECLRPLMKQHYRVDWACQALQTYAQLQQNEALQIEVLFALGVPDWRLAKLPDLYAELIARKDFLKAEGLSEQEINALGALKAKVQGICAQLLKYSIPETIEHGDFHDNNILRQGDRLIVNDWGDAVISHPFFSLVSFLDSARRNHGILEGSEVYLKLRNAYLDAWSDYASEAQRLECFELAKQIGVIKFVISFYRVALCPGMAHLGQYQGTIAEGLRGFLK